MNSLIYYKIGYLLLTDTLFGFLLNLSNFSREALVILILFLFFNGAIIAYLRKESLGHNGKTNSFIVFTYHLHIFRISTEMLSLKIRVHQVFLKLCHH